jgi:hypothetical protein
LFAVRSSRNCGSGASSTQINISTKSIAEIRQTATADLTPHN